MLSPKLDARRTNHKWPEIIIILAGHGTDLAVQAQNQQPNE